MQFRAPESADVAPQLFAGKTSYAEASAVSVTTGQTTSNVNAAMRPGGSVEGTVFDSSTGEPVRGAEACVFEQGDEFSESCGFTGAAGHYLVRGLTPATSDRVGFFGGQLGATAFANEYYIGATTLEAASPVGVTEGQTTSEIDGGFTRTATPVAGISPFPFGHAEVGRTLGDEPARWLNGPTAFGYQWLRCDASGRNCAAISGAVGRTYTVTSADAGHTLRILETASNEYGSGVPSVSPATLVVPGGSQPPGGGSQPPGGGSQPPNTESGQRRRALDDDPVAEHPADPPGTVRRACPDGQGRPDRERP